MLLRKPCNQFKIKYCVFWRLILEGSFDFTSSLPSWLPLFLPGSPFARPCSSSTPVLDAFCTQPPKHCWLPGPYLPLAPSEGGRWGALGMDTFGYFCRFFRVHSKLVSWYPFTKKVAQLVVRTLSRAAAPLAPGVSICFLSGRWMLGEPIIHLEKLHTSNSGNTGL